ncbi:MAG: Winged helix DNA-binding domain [Chloroflexi bacterium]|jgi:DNA-binding MarR family transcriptional regulator|nr:Winged helix DNA-binding domain [Chloroflexota bacterium]
MRDDFKESIGSMALEIRAQARDLKVDTFLAFIYTSDLVNKYLDIELGSQPLTRAGFNILHILILHEGTMQPTEISKEILRSKHSVSNAIDTLERQGLVKSEVSTRDRRVRKISITRRGLNLVKKATTSSRERLSQNLFRDLDKRQLEQFNTILKKIRRDTLALIKESRN